MNFLVGLIPGTCWGMMPPFSKKIGGKPEQQTLGICFSVLVLGLVIFLISVFYKIDYLSKNGILCFLVAFLSGVCWFFGGMFQLDAIKKSKVSIVMPISSVSQVLTISLFSAFVFKTWLNEPIKQLSFGFGMIIIMLIGVYLTSIEKKSEQKTSLKPIIIPLIISTSGFFLYGILSQVEQDFIGNPNIDFFDAGNLFPQSLGMFLCALMYATIKTFIKKEQKLKQFYSDKKIYLNTITGVFQALGNLFYFVSVKLNTTVIASPLGQLSLVVATLLGIFWNKEIKKFPYLLWTIIGLVLIVSAGIMLGFMDNILYIKSSN